jgi:hypothetical protein
MPGHFPSIHPLSLVTDLCLHQASSLRPSPIALKRPLSSSHGDKLTYKFIVSGRWVTNPKPTQVYHGFINNVHTAPPKSVPP